MDEIDNIQVVAHEIEKLVDQCTAGLKPDREKVLSLFSDFFGTIETGVTNVVTDIEDVAYDYNKNIARVTTLALVMKAFTVAWRVFIHKNIVTESDYNEIFETKIRVLDPSVRKIFDWLDKK